MLINIDTCMLISHETAYKNQQFYSNQTWLLDFSTTMSIYAVTVSISLLFYNIPQSV